MPSPTGANAGRLVRSLKCVDGAFCQPKSQETLFWEMLGAKPFTFADLADQAKSIRPAAKQVIAGMELERRREVGNVMNYEMTKERIKELKAKNQANSETIEFIRRRLAAGIRRRVVTKRNEISGWAHRD